MSDHLNTDIIVECKNSELPWVFFSRADRHPQIGTLLFDGNPPMLREFDEDFEEDVELPLEQEFEFEKFHQNWNVEFQAHKFAKLESKIHNRGSKANESIDWRLTHTGMSDAVEKLCKACHAYSKDRKDCAKMDINGQCEYSFSAIYPLIICSNEIFECRVSGSSYELIATDHIQLNWNIECSAFRQDYRIHVVRESALQKFLKRVRKDHKSLRKKLDKNRSRIYESVRSYDLRHRIPKEDESSPNKP